MPRYPSINFGGGSSGGGNGDPPEWGRIIGNLSAQADLTAALEAKANVEDVGAAEWGHIGGVLTDQADLMALLGIDNPAADLVMYEFSGGSISSPLVAGVGRDYVRPGSSFTIVGWLAALYAPSSAGPVVFDLNVNRLSVFNAQKILIDEGEKSSRTASAQPEGLFINVHADSEMTVDIDAAGTGAMGWKVWVFGLRAELGATPPAPVPGITPPHISGTGAVGQTLTLTFVGDWANAPLGYAVEWLRDGVVVDWVSGTTYVQKPEDAGHSITARVAASNGGGTGSALSNAIPVALPVPENTRPPSLGTQATEGVQITVDPGDWRYSATSYGYFYRARPTPDAAWAPIVGAVTNKFSPPPTLVGYQISVGVQALNGTGPSAIVYSDPLTVQASRFSQSWPPMPVDRSTWDDPTVPLVGSHATYNVGPGKTYAELTDVPWLSLVPGDVVNVFYRPTPYRTKIGLNCVGTASQWIVIHGVADSAGNLPHITGDGAVTMTDGVSPDGIQEPFFSAAYTETLGVIYMTRKFQYGVPVKPKFIRIQYLKVTGGHASYTFTDQFGNSRSWGNGTGGIVATVVENLTIRGCIITDNGNGVFINTKDDVEAYTSYFVTIEGCQVYDNGNEDSPYEHNLYVQCVRSLYQGNYIGSLRPKALGSSLKDRSSGTCVRFNSVKCALRAFDLVDAEDGQAVIRTDPLYRVAFAYGNLVVNDFRNQGVTKRYGSGGMFHWSGDNDPATYRNGTLYFYNNTVAILGDSTDSYHVGIFDGSGDRSVFEISSNVFAKYGTAYLHLGGSGFPMNLKGTNWITSGWVGSWSGSATINQSGTLLEGADPGLSSIDYTIIEGSPLINGGASVISPALAYVNAEALRVDYQPGPTPGTHIPRPKLGVEYDIGCFETDVGSAAPPPPPPPEILEPGTDRVFYYAVADGLTPKDINYKWDGATSNYVTSSGALRLADANLWTSARIRFVDGQGADQSAELVRRGQTWGPSASGLRLTLQDDGTNYYAAEMGSSSWQIYRNGSWIAGGSGLSVDWTANVKLTFTIASGVLHFYLNGTALNGAGTTDSAPLTGGFPGLHINANGTTTGHYIESWTDTPV